ncbi:cytochrome P450 2K6-like [Dendropsophus ebraccatus]|uniref:cytochrome P450 2K6-like n=1 Tax=Dendropsophus ebraccatus TaxID=150705 RepID=UPI003831AEAA
MDLGFSVASYFVLVLTLFYILNVLKNWNKNDVTNFPPGPRCLPLIGNLHQMDLKKPDITFLELTKKYGPVFSVQLGMQKMVVLTGYETVKDALVNHAEDFGERRIPKIYENLDKGMGVIFSNGENWKIMRRFTLTTLRDFGMGKSTIEEKIADECTYLTTYFASFKGKPFDNTLILNAAVANIIVAILLGIRMDYDEPQFKRLLSLTNEYIRLLGSPIVSLTKKYGPVFSVKLGMQKMVVLTGYETVKDALVNNAEDFGERGVPYIFKNLDKEMGVIFSNGENWKIMRRFTITTLRDFGMGKSTIEEKIADECTYLTTYFASFKGKPFDNTLILNAAVANIIVAILLGIRMDYDDSQFKRLLSLTNEYIRLLGSPMVGLVNVFPFLWIFPGSHKTIERNMKELRDFIRRTFVEHLKNLDENDQRSLIDVFLVKQKEEAGNPQSFFHNENLTILVKNLFSAGMETTSTTLRWALLLMMKYPEVQEKVQEEISRVIGLAQPMYSHRGQMPFTHAVISEIQRFSDIAPLSASRTTAKDVTFKGYFIPQGTYIMPVLTSILKDKTQFEKPDEFYPQHFLDAKGNFIKKDAFMPFCAGRRACAGETLARMELFMFFTSLLQKFTFSLPPGVTDVDMTSVEGLARSPLPHKICAVPRF